MTFGFALIRYGITLDWEGRGGDKKLNAKSINEKDRILIRLLGCNNNKKTDQNVFKRIWRESKERIRN